MRQYKILEDATATDLEEAIRAKSLAFKNLRVEGFHYDGTNYIALVSYEV